MYPFRVPEITLRAPQFRPARQISALHVAVRALLLSPQRRNSVIGLSAHPRACNFFAQSSLTRKKFRAPHQPDHPRVEIPAVRRTSSIAARVHLRSFFPRRSRDAENAKNEKMWPELASQHSFTREQPDGSSRTIDCQVMANRSPK